MKKPKVLSARASCFLLLSTSLVCAQSSVRATTDGGKQVILKSDGTWQYAETDSAHHTKSATATTKVKAPFGDFVLWVDPAKWQQTKETKRGFYFDSVDGAGHAGVISDGTPVPLASFKELVVANAKSQDPSARIISEEDRIVNGHQLLCMQMELRLASLPTEFYGYYFGGSSGSIQVVTWTVIDAFSASKSAFTEFLDGLEINDNPFQPTPPAVGADQSGPEVQHILLNDGKAVIAYDARKWKQEKSDSPSLLYFQLLDGQGKALAIVENLRKPTDTLPDIALSDARHASPDAKIVSQEKRVVNGTSVWCLKIQGTFNGVPILSYGYYYGGKAGTVQLITSSQLSLFDVYQHDFTEFLNGLQIKE